MFIGEQIRLWVDLPMAQQPLCQPFSAGSKALLSHSGTSERAKRVLSQFLDSLGNVYPGGNLAGGPLWSPVIKEQKMGGISGFPSHGGNDCGDRGKTNSHKTKSHKTKSHKTKSHKTKSHKTKSHKSNSSRKTRD